MPAARVPGPICVSRAAPIDEGTLVRWRSPVPGPINPPARQWHHYSRADGFLAMTLTLSPEAVDLLKAIETLRLKPYDDQTAKDIDRWTKGATIGYGHLVGKNEWPEYENGITEQQAEALFRSDVAPYERTVGEAVSARLQQYQFDALVIFAFNIGQAEFSESAVVKLVNHPDAITAFRTLEDAWKAWNKSQGRVSTGLINRRAAEWRIYTKALYARW